MSEADQQRADDERHLVNKQTQQMTQLVHSGVVLPPMYVLCYVLCGVSAAVLATGHLQGVVPIRNAISLYPV